MLKKAFLLKHFFFIFVKLYEYLNLCVFDKTTDPYNQLTLTLSNSYKIHSISEISRRVKSKLFSSHFQTDFNLKTKKESFYKLENCYNLSVH